MKSERLKELDKILNDVEMNVIPLKYVRHISMYDSQYGWVSMDKDDYEDLCNGEYILEDFAPTEIEYHLDFDFIKTQIIDISNKILEGYKIDDLE